MDTWVRSIDTYELRWEGGWMCCSQSERAPEGPGNERFQTGNKAQEFNPRLNASCMSGLSWWLLGFWGRGLGRGGSEWWGVVKRKHAWGVSRTEQLGRHVEGGEAIMDSYHEVKRVREDKEACGRSGRTGDWDRDCQRGQGQGWEPGPSREVAAKSHGMASLDREQEPFTAAC